MSVQTDAFSTLVTTYKDRALSLALRLLKDRDDAEDALQEAFVKAYQGMAAFRGEAQTGTWFFRIVYNTCLNVLKKRRRQPVHDVLDEDIASVWTEPAVFDTIDRAVLEDVLREELECMPPLYAAVMDLFYVQECSYEQICRITAMPLGTVKTRLNRGRSLLRAAVLARCPDLVDTGLTERTHE